MRYPDGPTVGTRVTRLVTPRLIGCTLYPANIFNIPLR